MVGVVGGAEGSRGGFFSSLLQILSTACCPHTFRVGRRIPRKVAALRRKRSRRLSGGLGAVRLPLSLSAIDH